ncbi:MAG: glycosyltransferase family 4 protein [Formivibrio sp.]|nr:glycosyltransferase family 4 protein [Formivibrio sp.]
MNIVFVSKECPPSPRSSGIGTYVWETGSALAHIGHNVTIIAASDDGRLTSSMPIPRMTVIRLPDDEVDAEKRNVVARYCFAPLNQGTAYRKRVADCIANVTENQHPDVIEFPGFRGESIMWLAKQRSLPIIVRMHGLTGGTNAVWTDHVSATKRLKLNWERQEVNAADVITVVSEHQALSVRTQFGADRVQVVHNSIDANRWRTLSQTAPQELDSTDLLFVGSLVTKKGIFVLLRAATRLRQTGWRGRLIMAGKSAAQFERFLRLRAVLGIKLPDWVVHLGICQRERLAGLYRDARACCFPSFVDSFPYTCLEAMACGGLVIGSLRTGMAEMLTETTGFLVPPGDVSELAVALRSALLMSDDERQRMKDAAQQRVCDRFDNGVIIPKLLNVYNETIHSYKARC